MTFNVCICIDLILMIKHPFVSKSKRIIRYHIFTYIVASIAVLENLNEEVVSSDQNFMIYT